MTTLAPETIPLAKSPNSPAYEDPAPKAARKPRASWTQADVAQLAAAHAVGARPLLIGDHGAEACTAKLIELGLLEKTTYKVVLSDDQRFEVDGSLEGFTGWDEPQRTLAVRYAIKALSALLPKRAAK
jgi:hypothetical protein